MQKALLVLQNKIAKKTDPLDAVVITCMLDIFAK